MQVIRCSETEMLVFLAQSGAIFEQSRYFPPCLAGDTYGNPITRILYRLFGARRMAIGA
jgi:hypothetical protein